MGTWKFVEDQMVTPTPEPTPEPNTQPGQNPDDKKPSDSQGIIKKTRKTKIKLTIEFQNYLIIINTVIKILLKQELIILLL